MDGLGEEVGDRDACIKRLQKTRMTNFPAFLKIPRFSYHILGKHGKHTHTYTEK